MSLPAGTRLGPYEIVAPLGAGGMGEVYRAKDTKLNRDVAIKVLPESFALDADRVARFTREAQVLASLNHPNIAAIYGIEDSAIVMELVSGEDLSAHVARGAMPLSEALPIAKQIADALEAAHEQGIVHRDLKPANIKVRADGTVKVLDFGLAKALDPNASGATADAMNSPTMTARATQIGMIIGTAAYMSPEQARGKSVDKRADIWAFGVVLYEMLSGRRAFVGDDISITLANVLKDDVNWGALPASTPPRVRALIARCLERDIRARLRDIGEARIVLGHPPEAASAADTPRRAGRSWMVAGALAMAALAAATAWYAKPVPVLPLRRIELPANMAGLPTPGMVGAQRPALSRDGASVAYVDSGHLWVRGLEAVDSRDLGAVPPDTHALAWSTDGRTLAFAAEQTLRTIPATGGATFVVGRIPGTGRLMGLVWSPEGQLVMAVWRGDLCSVPATGGELTVRLAVDASKEVDFHEVALAPNGGLIVSTHLRASSDIRVELVDGVKRTALWDGTGVTRVVYSGPDVALVQRTAPNTGVWMAHWAAGRLDLASAQPVAAGAVWFAAADDGSLLYGLPSQVPSTWVWSDRTGRLTTLPGAPHDIVTKATLSPDGRRVAFAARKSGKTDIFVRELDTGADTQLTFTSPDTKGIKFNPSNTDPFDAVQSPTWFPSGDRLVYAAGGVESASLVSQRADRAEPAQPMVPGELGLVSSDGRFLLSLVPDRGAAHLRLYAIAADGSLGPPQVVLDPTKEPDVNAFEVSRDGRLLAYTSRETVTRLYLTSWPDARGRVPVDENGRDPHFSPDGRELFYVTSAADSTGRATESLMHVPIVSVSPVKIGLPNTIYTERAGGPSLQEFNVAPDGQRFLLRMPVARTSADGAKLVYVQNWRAGLKK